MFICQVIVIILIVYSFFKNLYHAIEGRPAIEATGGVGGIAVIILFSIIITIEYWAGMFDKFFFMAQ